MNRSVILVVASLMAAASPRPAGAEQPLEVEWVLTAGGDKHDKTRGIAVDRDGNVLLTGEFTGTVMFGERQLTSVGDMDCFVAKVSPDGHVLWVQSGGGTGIDRGYAVATDAAGNSYVTGHFNSSEISLGELRAASVGDYDIFVAKYAPDGTLVWLKTGGGPGYDFGHGVAVTSTGAVVFTGALVGEGTWDGRPVGHAGPAHLFCASLATDGATGWFIVATGATGSRGQGIAADAHGRCYVGGAAGATGDVAGRPFSGRGAEDPVVVCFAADGSVRWLFQGLGGGRAAVHEIAADATGAVWAAGMFRDELWHDGRTTASAGDYDILLFSLDTDGTLAWAKTGGGPGVDYGLGVVADDRGNSYFCGSFRDTITLDGTRRLGSASGDAYVASFDRAGVCRGWFQTAGRGTEHAYTIARDAAGATFISGAASGPATFGRHSVSNRGSNDLFLARLKAP
jgi:hypothetical protein